jgi:hypothetical protein
MDGAWKGAGTGVRTIAEARLSEPGSSGPRRAYPAGLTLWNSEGSRLRGARVRRRGPAVRVARRADRSAHAARLPAATERLRERTHHRAVTRPAVGTPKPGVRFPQVSWGVCSLRAAGTCWCPPGCDAVKVKCSRSCSAEATSVHAPSGHSTADSVSPQALLAQLARGQLRAG